MGLRCQECKRSYIWARRVSEMGIPISVIMKPMMMLMMMITTVAGGANRKVVAELVSADAQPSSGRAPCRTATGSGQGALLGFSWPTRVIDVSDLT